MRLAGLRSRRDDATAASADDACPPDEPPARPATDATVTCGFPTSPIGRPGGTVPKASRAASTS